MPRKSKNGQKSSLFLMRLLGHKKVDLVPLSHYWPFTVLVWYFYLFVALFALFLCKFSAISDPFPLMFCSQKGLKKWTKKGLKKGPKKGPKRHHLLPFCTIFDVFWSILFSSQSRFLLTIFFFILSIFAQIFFIF